MHYNSAGCTSLVTCILIRNMSVPHRKCTVIAFGLEIIFVLENSSHKRAAEFLYLDPVSSLILISCSFENGIEIN